MATSIKLAWIVVRDIKKAIAFYTDVVGLKLENFHEEYGWAELIGTDGGCRLGVAAAANENQIAPGGNAVVTIVIPNMETAKVDMEKKGAKMLGDVMVVPGQVKLQTFQDQDGNTFQLVEEIR